MLFFAESFAEADIRKMKNILLYMYSTLYEQVDALETERTEENHTTKKQNLT